VEVQVQRACPLAISCKDLVFRFVVSFLDKRVTNTLVDVVFDHDVVGRGIEQALLSVDVILLLNALALCNSCFNILPEEVLGALRVILILLHVVTNHVVSTLLFKRRKQQCSAGELFLHYVSLSVLQIAFLVIFTVVRQLPVVGSVGEVRTVLAIGKTIFFFNCLRTSWARKGVDMHLDGSLVPELLRSEGERGQRGNGALVKVHRGRVQKADVNCVVLIRDRYL